MIFNPAIEQLPKVELRKLQSQRMMELVDYMYHHQPFYKQTWDAVGIDINEVNSISDLPIFPLTKKEDLRNQYPFGLQAVPPSQILRIHCSSGSTGKPTVIGYTKGDLDIFSEVVARSLACAGAKPGMKLHNAYGYGLFTGGLGLHYGAELLGMSVIPVSGGMTDRQLMLLKDFGSEVICCTPSYALTLADEIVKQNLSGKINLKYAVLGAEPWTETVRQEIEEKLKVTATNIYGLSEIIGPGVSQEDFEEKNGSHIWEDHFYPEVIDPDNEEVLPLGKEGILVLTTLTKRGMPLMRYMTNDICSLSYDPESKRSHIKMSAVKGRYDDMLIIRGVNIYPSQIEELLGDLDQISTNYQLVVDRKDRLDSLEVKVELNDQLYQEKGVNITSIRDSDAFLRQIQYDITKKIKSRIGLNVKVTLADKGEVPRSEGGKLNRVLDNR